MESSLAVPIGVIVARTRIDVAWQNHAWRSISVLLGGLNLQAGSLVRVDGETAYFFAGDAILELHAADIASYRDNIEQHTPRVYVVLNPQDEVAGPPSPQAHLVTIAPDEAESYLEGDDFLMDSVAMPVELLKLVCAFIRAHQPEPPRATVHSQSTISLSQGRLS